MKQDLILYLVLPFPVLFSVTIIASLLPLLNLINISAQLNYPQSSPPQYEFFFIMVIAYYAIVTFIAWINFQTYSAKIKMLSATTNAAIEEYGKQTNKKLKQLFLCPEFKEWEWKQKNKNETGSHKKQDSQKSRGKGPKSIHNDDQQEQSENERQGKSCHQMATTIKMF